MTTDEFRKHAHSLVEWMADYMENVESYPVKSSVSPGDIFSQIPENPPFVAESFESLMKDIDKIIIPGVPSQRLAHWFGQY